MKKLKIILQYNIIYYLLLFICFLYLIFYFLIYKCDHKYQINDTSFNIIIHSYSINGNKLKINTNNLVCFYYFNTLEEKNNFINSYSLGDSLMVYGTLSKPDNNTIPNTFNYKKYLYYKNIEYILNIKSFYKEKINHNFLYKIKNSIYRRINRIKNNEYLYVFILGDTSYMDSNIYQNYKTNGITHLYAVSGLHISLFSSFLFKIFRKIKLKYIASFILVFIFLLFYSFIVGFTPSVLRAVIFFTLNRLFKIFKIRTNIINILYLTVVIILLIKPGFIFNIGFILSVVISFFLLLCKGNSLFKTSLIAFLSSAPIIINNYHEINILSVFNNLLFVPVISKIVFPFTIICLLFSKLNIILKIMTNILEYISLICSKVLTFNIIFPKMNYLEIIIYYILLIFSFRNKKYYIFILLLMILISFKPFFNTNDRIYYLDIKQGDSTLIISNNKSILIDTGGIIKQEDEEWKKNDKNTMIMSIIPFFKSIGIRKIDYLIITHGDYDHMGEAINLIENFKVKEVIFNCGEFNKLEKELIEILDKKKIQYYSCINRIDNLYFLGTKEYNSENDNSNVIYIEINGYRFMFMGDAGVNKEKDILEKYNISNIDVLKVGHHGSKTSSSEEFINQINPKYSVISVGKNNRYGHPNKEVLNNLKDSKIYRTDQDGSIMFKIKNNKLKIEKYSP